jgi:hypothetical protein
VSLANHPDIARKIVPAQARSGAVTYANSLHFSAYAFNEFCKIEVRHTLKRKNCFLIFSFQTVGYCVISN